MTSSSVDHELVAAIGHKLAERGLRREGTELRFRCVVAGHEDATPTARWNPAKAVWRCDACNVGGGALDLAKRLGIETPREGRGASQPRRKGRKRANAPRGGAEGGCTLVAYAESKGLPAEWLRSLDLSEIYIGAPCVRIPYHDAAGHEVAVRYRVRLEKASDGDGRFRWRKGSKVVPYGLDRLGSAREAGYVLLVEGESDAQTAWWHRVPALGLPGACTWNENFAVHLDGIATIYVVQEPDRGGETLIGRLRTSSLRERIRVVTLPAKDVSALHLHDSARFVERLRAAMDAAVPLLSLEQARLQAERVQAWEKCSELAGRPDILAELANDLKRAGLAGEERAGKLVYLSLVSRHLDRPISAALKGASSSGKSAIVEDVLRFVRPEAYFELSAMSDRALAYLEEPLAHRMLVLYEAAGLSSEMATYLVRSLLSEGKVRYATVEKTSQGLRQRTIELPGPTGLILTTTRVRLHPENETRLLSIPTLDTPEQTRAVLAAIANGADDGEGSVDRTRWHALDHWLELGEHRVAMPWAVALAHTIPPLAVRLRRDFSTLLAVIKAHAILHQASRERDAKGRIVASFDDYATARELVADLIGEQVRAAVSPAVRQAVEAVEALAATGPVSISAVAAQLNIDVSAASRRVRAAIEAGFMSNEEPSRGEPARLMIGEPMPKDRSLLPTAEELEASVCTFAGVARGVEHPPLPRCDGDVTVVTL